MKKRFRGITRCIDDQRQQLSFMAENGGITINFPFKVFRETGIYSCSISEQVFLSICTEINLKGADPDAKWLLLEKSGPKQLSVKCGNAGNGLDFTLTWTDNTAGAARNCLVITPSWEQLAALPGRFFQNHQLQKEVGAPAFGLTP